MLKRLLVSAAAALALASPAAAQPHTSVYTDLGEPKCRNATVSDGADRFPVLLCPGVAGYKLHVLDDDDRQSVTVVTPDGVWHPLDLWHTVSGAFSTVGPRAEWRVRRVGKRAEPFALIVRFNASEQPDHPERTNSYLAVAKITPRMICVTDKIPPGPNANLLARRAADAAAGKECLGTGTD